MLAPVTVSVALLLVVSCLYLKAKAGQARKILRSAAKDILIIDTALSVIISYWIISADVTFDCDDRIADFLINVSNGVYFSILLGRLASKFISRPRIAKVCLKITAPRVLIFVQIVLAAVAHFGTVGDKNEKPLVPFCYDERSTSTSTASYCYGFVLLVMCIVLLFAALYRDRSHFYNTSRKIGTVCLVLLSTTAAVVYSVALSFVLSTQEVNDCERHAQFFVILACNRLYLWLWRWFH